MYINNIDELKTRLLPLLGVHMADGRQEGLMNKHSHVLKSITGKVAGC